MSLWCRHNARSFADLSFHYLDRFDITKNWTQLRSHKPNTNYLPSHWVEINCVLFFHTHNIIYLWVIGSRKITWHEHSVSIAQFCCKKLLYSRYFRACARQQSVKEKNVGQSLCHGAITFLGWEYPNLPWKRGEKEAAPPVDSNA